MRDRRLYIRVTEEEYFMLQRLASDTNMSISEYMRRCGCKQRITSRLDQKGLKALLKVNADLARLGNLFKFAMTEFADVTGDLAQKLTEDAYKHMADTDEMRTLLKQKIANLKR